VEHVEIKKRVRKRKEGTLKIFPLAGLCSMVENNNRPSTMLSHCTWQVVTSLELVAVKHEANTFDSVPPLVFIPFPSMYNDKQLNIFKCSYL